MFYFAPLCFYFLIWQTKILITYLQNSNLNCKKNLLVCQNSQIIENQNTIYIYFNENPLKSDSDNYITVQFNENTEYDSCSKIESCTSRKLYIANFLSIVLFK